MTTIADVMAELQEEFHRSFVNAIHKDDPELIKKMKTKAWQRFMQLGLPQSHSDAFQYMHLQPLLKHHFHRAMPLSSLTDEIISSAVLDECRESCFVFVNGHFAPKLSNRVGLPESVVALQVKQACRTYGSLLQNNWTQGLKTEQDPFAVLNLASHQDGIFVYVPPKVVVERPIQLLHIISQEGLDRNNWMMPRLELFQSAYSQLTIAATTLWKTSEPYFYNPMTAITLEEGAYCRYIQDALSNCDATSGWFFDTVRATLQRSAVFKNTQLSNGKAFIRRSTQVSLAGENSEVALHGIAVLQEKQETHSNVLVTHKAPHTRSLQLFKNVLNDQARSSFQGKIYVKQEAQKTEAYQLNNNLLLGDQAEANSKPNLEIFADDVKASHGATFGQLNEEQILYLQTRGIPKEEAKKCLIVGFCQEIIEMVPILSIRQSALHMTNSL
jgi:Fe-S cluster assembly protein SufD